MIATIPARHVTPGDIISIDGVDRLVLSNQLVFWVEPLRRIAVQHGRSFRFEHFQPDQPVTITGHKETK